MDFGLSGSLAAVVLVAEFIARDRRLLAAIEVSDETLAVDVLQADRWLETGGHDVTEKARLKARELLATHEAPALPGDVVARVDAAIAGL